MTFALVVAVKNIKSVVAEIRRKTMVAEINQDWESELKTLQDKWVDLGRSL